MRGGEEGAGVVGARAFAGALLVPCWYECSICCRRPFFRAHRP